MEKFFLIKFDFSSLLADYCFYDSGKSSRFEKQMKIIHQGIERDRTNLMQDMFIAMRYEDEQQKTKQV